VFDLAGPASLADVRLVSLAGPPGYRLDVALGPPGGTSTVEVAPEPGPEPPPAGTPLDLVTLVATALADLAPPPVTVPPAAVPTGLAPPLPARKPVIALPVIVIDAGHGGNDPGALAPTGLYEKELTLLAARELRDLLRRTGRFAVVLTRESDVFLPLEERVEIARRHEADLFISLHCDALDDRSVRGATVYTLSETASDAEAQALAAKENESDLLAAIDLASAEAYDVATTSILYDLARRDTMNVSARFAARLSEEVGRVMALRRNTHRFAGFRVLKAPDVPSVLFEMGYLSNAKDLRILANADSRRELLRAVVAAIDAHFAIVTASGA
jgi:N-acetylmuramoyl-L-alanine amidase